MVWMFTYFEMKVIGKGEPLYPQFYCEDTWVQLLFWGVPFFNTSKGFFWEVLQLKTALLIFLRNNFEECILTNVYHWKTNLSKLVFRGIIFSGNVSWKIGKSTFKDKQELFMQPFHQTRLSLRWNSRDVNCAAENVDQQVDLSVEDICLRFYPHFYDSAKE